MHRERAARRDALFVQRIARRPAARRALSSRHRGNRQCRGLMSSAASESSASGSRRRVSAPRRTPACLRARAGTHRARSPWPGPGPAREAGGDEHPVVREGEGRPAAVQPPPAARPQQIAAARAPCVRAPRRLPERGLRPGPGRRTEARARPVDDLDGAALGRGVGKRAGERAQGLGVDPGEGRQLDDEAGAGRR